MEDCAGQHRTDAAQRQLGWRVLLALCFVALLGYGVDYQQQRVLESEHRAHASDIANKLSSIVQHELDAQLLLVRGLAAYAKVDPEMSATAFAGFLQGLGGDVARLRGIIWAPDAVVRHRHPTTSNDIEVGYDLFVDPESLRLARRAIRERVLVLAGPMPLRSGDLALMAHQPVFGERGGEEFFLGFASTLIDLATFLAELEAAAAEDEVQIALRSAEGEGSVFHGNAELFEPGQSLLSTLNLPAGSWQLAVSSQPQGAEADQFERSRLAVVLASVLSSVLLLLAIYRDHRARCALQRTTEALHREQIRLSAAQQLAGIGNWELDFRSQTLSWSEEVYRIFEIEPAQFANSYPAFLELLHPDDRLRVDAVYSRSLRSREPCQITHRLLMKDGRVKHLIAGWRTCLDEDGEPLRSYGMVRDITERMLKDSALRASEERYRTITDYAFGWEYWQTPDGNIPYMSAGCVDISGYLADEFKFRPGLLREIVHADDRAAFIQLQERLFRKAGGADAGNLNFRIVTRDGDVRWIAHGWYRAFGDGGRALGVRASNSDITDIKDAELHARKLAFFDSLTGLPNRRMLFDRLELALKQARRFQRLLAVLFLDVDKFKEINDQYGHEIGDHLLIEIGRRLQACVRAGDTIARNGGDEFVVVLIEIASQNDVFVVAEKICRALAEDFVLGEHRLQSCASIGIAVFDGSSEDSARDLLRKADMAMYEAKRRDCGKFLAYDDTLQSG